MSDELIHQLTSDCRPVGKPLSVRLQMALWLTATALSSYAGLLIIGMGVDVAHHFSSPLNVVEFTLAVGTGVAAATAAMLLAVPGRLDRHAIRWAIILSVGLWGLFLGIQGLQRILASTETILSVSLGLACLRNMLIFSFVPAIVFIALIRQAAPTNLTTVGMLFGLSVTAFGSVGATFCCGINCAAHSLLWHMLPVIVFGLGGLAVGKRLFHW